MYSGIILEGGHNNAMVRILHTKGNIVVCSL